MAMEKHRYYVLPSDDLCDVGEPSSRGNEISPHSIPGHDSGKSKHGLLSNGRQLLLLNSVLFVISAIMLALSITNTSDKTNWLLQQTSYYCELCQCLLDLHTLTDRAAPMFSRFDIQLEERVVAGTLFNEDMLSDEDLLLRSYPNQRSDDAWRSRTDVGIITITSDEVRRLGKDPDKTVKAPPELGFGTDAHLAEIDGQHALHCLYAVRRYAYREYYFPEMNAKAAQQDKSPLEPFHEAHLSHCLHILLQTLSCNPSLDVITHNWVETQLYPFPDFAIQKKCLNHRQLLAWQSDNQLSAEQWKTMAAVGPQANETILPLPQKMREWSEDEDAKTSSIHPAHVEG